MLSYHPSNLSCRFIFEFKLWSFETWVLGAFVKSIASQLIEHFARWLLSLLLFPLSELFFPRPQHTSESAAVITTRIALTTTPTHYWWTYLLNYIAPKLDAHFCESRFHHSGLMICFFLFSLFWVYFYIQKAPQRV